MPEDKEPFIHNDNNIKLNLVPFCSYVIASEQFVQVNYYFSFNRWIIESVQQTP